MISGGKIVDIYSDWTQIDLSPYVGKTVLTINGADALTYIENWSNGLYISKDPAVRLNQALKSDFTIQWNANLPMPTSDNITFTFEGVSQPLSIPYFVFITQAISGTTQFTSLLQPSASPTSFANSDERMTFIARRLEMPREVKDAIDILQTTPALYNPGLENDSGSGGPSIE